MVLEGVTSKLKTFRTSSLLNAKVTPSPAGHENRKQIVKYTGGQADGQKYTRGLL